MMKIKADHRKRVPTFKHGWNEADQEDLDLPSHGFQGTMDEPQEDPIYEQNDVFERTSSPLASTCSSTSDEELTWDDSPEQLTLHLTTPMISPPLNRGV